MFRKSIHGCFLILSLLVTGAAANAHHSFAATFKSDAVISVEGVVTEFRFKNPHVLVYFDVTNEDGTVTHWVSEGSSATGKRRDGWDRDTIQIGQFVRISGDSTHDGSPMVSMESVEFLDANSGAVVRTLGEEPSSDSAEPLVTLPLKLVDGRPNLSGAWDRIRSGSRGGSPESLDGVPPFNAAGKAAQAAYNLTEDPQVFCEPPGVVRQAGFTPHVVRITQNDDHVVLEYEEYGGRRVVNFGDELPAAGEKSHLGDSVARYEGDTLVIETRNLLSNPSHPYGYQTSDQVSTLEIYKRADEPEIGSILHATMIVTDTGYLTEPWELIRERSYRDGYEFIENDCRPPLRKKTTKTDG
jgi:hypothetical protein